MQEAISLILRAAAFAAHKHRDQRRKGAEASPYINHPIAVANLLANEAAVTDGAVLVAALLHRDEKMRAISDATTTVDTQKAAVLAALAIADELHSGLRERGDREELLREQAERCLTLVERALKQTA